MLRLRRCCGSGDVTGKHFTECPLDALDRVANQVDRFFRIGRSGVLPLFLRTLRRVLRLGENAAELHPPASD